MMDFASPVSHHPLRSAFDVAMLSHQNAALFRTSGSVGSLLDLTVPLASQTSLVFLDPGVANYQSLQAGVVAGAEVYVLDPEQDAIAQITQTLLTKQGVASVHIVSHGSVGGLNFAHGTLTLADLPEYSAQLQSWNQVLTDNANILLYGCHVAQGELGQAFVQILSQLTGADVAASNDLTGSSAQGGDWVLEVSTGEVKAALVFEATTLADYDAILPIVRASISADGTQGDRISKAPSISGDGRYVTFSSDASNLVSGDTNGRTDIFVKDIQTGAITRVSTATDGTESNNNSFVGSISADGRYVAFTSVASNLVNGDTNGRIDIFVKDIQTGAITRVSTAADGSEGNNNSYYPGISADGRYVVFSSAASNLVSGDTNGSDDIFVKDTQTGIIRRISTTADSAEGNSTSYDPSISADGRYVAFSSDASNLVSGDTNGRTDIFVKDIQTGAITRVSTAADGTEGNLSTLGAKISANGRFVALTSFASNLVSNDTNSTSDIFVKDIQTGAITRVSTAADGSEGNRNTSEYRPSISADGRYVAFTSFANNLVSSDTNNYTDIFVKDIQTGAITRVSTATDGSESNSYSPTASISADGRYVAFESLASNLVSGDTNGGDDIFVTSVEPQLSISPSTTSLNEGDSAATAYTFTVNLSGLSTQPVTVQYSTVDGTAQASDEDYQAVSNQLLTFAPGETQKTITILINGDTKYEADENFQVVLNTPAGATLGTSSATGTLLNDELQLSISPSTTNLSEGDTGGIKTYTFTVNLSGPSTQPVTVQYSTVDGTAQASDGDYQAVSNQLLIFAPSETQKTITILVNGDTKHEADESFQVSLNTPTGATLSTSSATGTLLNDDAEPSIYIGNTSVLEGNSGTTALTFTVHLSNPTDQAVTVDYNLVDGSATLANADYQALASNTLTFAAGQTEQTITINISGETQIEANETMRLQLSNPSSNATLTNTTAVGTIVNDDSAVDFSDFDGDGNPDFLWHNKQTGEVSIWKMNSTSLGMPWYIGTADPVWNAQALADFDGDGNTDILWSNRQTGDVGIWTMNDTSLRSAFFVAAADLSWKIEGLADFNGDRHVDILWRNTVNGDVGIWKMNGSAFGSASQVAPADLSWHIEGLADFDNDGKVDILWRNTISGNVGVWKMNGLSLNTPQLISAADRNWTIEGFADFDGDGQVDILWRNVMNGDVGIWKMNGTSFSIATRVGPAARNWKLTGLLDLNGDGKTDLLWRNLDSGDVGTWTMNGLTLDQPLLITSVSLEWELLI